MTLIPKFDLDMVMMYLHTKNEVSMSKGSKVIGWTDRNTHTDRHTDMTKNITYPHKQVVMTNEDEVCAINWYVSVKENNININ